MIQTLPPHCPPHPRHPRFAPGGGSPWPIALLLVVVGACRIEPVDAPRRQLPSATVHTAVPVAGAAVVGLMPNAELLRRITAMLCDAAGSDRDPREATYVALRALECERRAQGVVFSQALLMDADGWGAVSALPNTYLASDAAFAALSDRHGLSVGVSGPLAQADCDPAAPGDMGTAFADLMAIPGHPLPPGAAEPLGAPSPESMESSEATPDDTDLDAGAPEQPTLVAGDAIAEDGQDDEESVADAAVPTGPTEVVAGAPPSPRSVYGVLWRDGSGKLHGGLLATSRSTGEPGIAAGLDVMPGQLLYIGPGGGALVHGQRPHDPSRAAAPAASAVTGADRAAGADGTPEGRPDAAWVLPPLGPAAPRGSVQASTFLAQQCATFTHSVADTRFTRDPPRQATDDRGPPP